MKIFLLLIMGVSLSGCSGYVLLQVRKGDNHSNVDALIHKVVPSGALSPQGKDIARKHFESHKYKAGSRGGKRDPSDLDSIVVAIDSGAGGSGGGGGRARAGGAFDQLVQRLTAALQRGALHAVPRYRAELERFHIKPEIVHFKSGKPSVMFEVDARAALRSLQRLLGSRVARRYADQVAGRAAALYRQLRAE